MDFLLAFVLCYIGIGGVLCMIQRDMIYVPDRTRADLSRTGALPLDVVTDDELKLRGWYIPPKGNKPVAVFFHGNAGHAGHRDYAAVSFIRRGYGFLFVEYRGYGGNPGKPSEDGFYSDARAFINWLLTEGKISPEKIILFGESIGTGPAMKMAEEHPDFAGVILLSPYTSLPDLAQRMYPVYPAHLMVVDKFDNISRVREADMPILIIHGHKDRTIPFSHAQRLAAANGKAQLVALEKAGHNDTYMHGAEAAISAFIEQFQ